MKIKIGLFDHMVLQRDSANLSNARFVGNSPHSGMLQMRVAGPGRTANLPWDDVLIVTGDDFMVDLRGISSGGPYDVEMRILAHPKKPPLDTLMVRDVLVGDVWVLAGQSNMEGCGRMNYAVSPDPRVRAFYMHDAWGVAKDPLHELHRAVDPVHAAIGAGAPPPTPRVYGVGPGLAFAKEMLKRTGVPQGLISCAHGGTSMEQWNPHKKDLSGVSLYGAMLRRVVKCGGLISGVAWYQGESDASAGPASAYTARMQEFVTEVRDDLGKSKLPFVVVQIARVVTGGDPAHWNSIQEQQRRLPEAISRLAVAPAIDLALDDGIHIGGPDTERLGKRLAGAMGHLAAGRGAGMAPITLKKVTVKAGANGERGDVVVEFGNVDGELASGGRPVGFSVFDANNVDCVYGVELATNKAIVHTTISKKDLPGRDLWYGRGFNPVCNIHDSDDRAVPAFGPIRLS